MLRLTCFATAMLALTAGAASAQSPQSPGQAAGETPSPKRNEPILNARELSIDTDRRIYTAKGDVEVRVGGRVLKADEVTYDLGGERLRARGSVQITDADTGAVEFADEIELDEEFRNGFATRFSARLQNNAVIAASSAVREDARRNSLDQVVYTGCPVCEDQDAAPTWSLRARKATQNLDTQMITYRDAMLSVKGVPVLYTPYFAHPDPTSKRRSGLLTPDGGASSKYGAFVETPYYWAISPSQDITIAPMIPSDKNPLVKLAHRKRFFSGYVASESSFTYERDFDSDGDTFGEREWRGHFYGDGLFQVNKDWRWGFGAEHQSDDQYDQRYDIDGEVDIRGLFPSQPRQLLSQVFLTGQREDFYFEAAALNFQGLRDGDISEEIPRVLPALFAEKIFDFGGAGRVAANVSTAALFRERTQTLSTGERVGDTARATAIADYDAQFVVGPGVLIEPILYGRADAYRLDNGTDAGARDFTRSVGLAGARVSWPLIRHGENVDLIIEPIVMGAIGTKLSDDELAPNEDSLLFELDETNVFEPEAITNYDAWEGGARAAVGVSASAIFSNKLELTSLIGRRYRREADPRFNSLSNLAGKKSDYVTSVKAALPGLSADARVRFDDSLTVDRVDAGVNADLWRVRGAARYYRVLQNTSGDRDEGLAWNGAFEVSERWSAIFEQQRNISRRQDLNVALGVAYRDECSYFSIAYVRSGINDRQLGPSESIRFEFVLTGLGGVADREFD